MNWWRAFVSIGEERVSVIVVTFIIASIVSLVQVFTHGDISTNMLEFLGYLIGGVTVGAVGNMASNAYVSKRRDSEYIDDDNQPTI